MIALDEKAEQQKQESCIRSRGEAHTNSKVLELSIHKREFAEVREGSAFDTHDY